ncbi:hypothetical protein GQ42DRAFT_33654 [Ramicandelaber brevisporus]|nr:hypothetical protein GQ42DRAFT_33654 [Ramicandelaber brevisporus]
MRQQQRQSASTAAAASASLLCVAAREFSSARDCTRLHSIAGADAEAATEATTEATTAAAAKASAQTEAASPDWGENCSSHGIRSVLMRDRTFVVLLLTLPLSVFLCFCLDACRLAASARMCMCTSPIELRIRHPKDSPPAIIVIFPIFSAFVVFVFALFVKFFKNYRSCTPKLN